MRRSFSLYAGLCLTIGAASAVWAEAMEPHVVAWQGGMHELRQSSTILGDMAKGKRSFDAEIAASAATALQEEAGKIKGLFKTRAEDPESDAKPEIWESWEQFAADADDLESAAANLDPTSLDGLRAGMRQVGSACGACHRSFKD